MNKDVLRRKYLDELERFKDNTNFIKVITGVRRCGKSTLMSQFRDELKRSGHQNIVFINFEDIEYDDINNYLDLNRYIKENIDRETRTYVFLDEIQRVEGWERSINGLMTGYDADIYLTGSNAHILSSELSTFLTGRYVTINMFPLSFSEYCEFHSDMRYSDEMLFDLYLRYGAFPLIDPKADERVIRAILSGTYTSIIHNDVISRGQIRDVGDLDRLVKFMMINAGNPISINAISKSMGKTTHETVDRYIRLLEESFLLYKVDRYDLKSTAFSPTPKYYSVDTGLRNISLGYKDEDRGRLLENIVCLELLRRGNTLRVGKYGDNEIDFAATDNNGNTEYFQVTLSMKSDEVRERELRSLRAPNDSFPKTVLSTDSRIPSITKDGIRHIHVIDWLLSGTL